MADRETNKSIDTDTDLASDDQRWVEQATRHMRVRAAHLPGHIQSRLTTARHAAIAQGLSQPLSRRLQWPGFAATALLAAYISYTLLSPTTVDQLPMLDETEMAAAQETELLEELEFIAWMEAMEMADELETSSKG